MLYSLAILLSLSIYAALCGAIARIFARTGHSRKWWLLSFAPLALVLFSYGSDIFGVFPEIGRRILPLVVLVYLALLLTLAFKRWPTSEGQNA